MLTTLEPYAVTIPRTDIPLKFKADFVVNSNKNISLHQLPVKDITMGMRKKSSSHKCWLWTLIWSEMVNPMFTWVPPYIVSHKSLFAIPPTISQFSFHSSRPKILAPSIVTPKNPLEGFCKAIFSIYLPSLFSVATHFNTLPWMNTFSQNNWIGN